MCYGSNVDIGKGKIKIRTMDARQPKAMVVVGMQGCGKTCMTMKELSVYQKKYKRPVLIVDINGEYTKYKAVYYDAREPDRRKRAMGQKNSKDTGRMGIMGINQPRIYRVIGIRPDNIPMSMDELIELILTIQDYFINGLLILEDMNTYIRRQIPKDFYAFMIRLRHKGVDLIMHYQSIGDAHPDIWRQTKILRIHSTMDSVLAIQGKIPNFELTRIAEISVEINCLRGVSYKNEADKLKKELTDCKNDNDKKQLLKDINALNPYVERYYYYFLYVDFENMKILGISEKDFHKAAEIYLYETKQEMRNLMEREDNNGKKQYKTKKEAIDKLISDKMIYIT